MNWNQYKKRRGGMSLEEFASGCASEQELIERFSYRKIEDPPLEEIKKMFEVPQAPAQFTVPDVKDFTVLQPSKKTKVTSGSTGE